MHNVGAKWHRRFNWTVYCPGNGNAKTEKDLVDIFSRLGRRFDVGNFPGFGSIACNVKWNLPTVDQVAFVADLKRERRFDRLK